MIQEATLPAESVAPEESKARVSFGKELQAKTTGCRLSTYSLSCRRTMPKGAVGQVADLFSAEVSSIGGSRHVISRKHELVKPVYLAISKAKQLVAAYTYDYPEKGVRLIRLDRVEWLSGEIAKLQAELAEACKALDDGWADVKADAQERLGDLYDPGDYPDRPSEGYGLEISFPAIKPDDRLAQMHPELYAKEQARIQARFDEAILAAEAAATEQLAKMLSHLIERLAPDESGESKTLHESTVVNLKEFAERWKTLSIGSNDQLEALIREIEKAADGIDVKALRKADGGARAKVAEQFEGLREKVDALVVTRPVRALDLD